MSSDTPLTDAQADRAELVAALAVLVDYLASTTEHGYDPFSADPLIERSRTLLARMEK